MMGPVERESKSNSKTTKQTRKAASIGPERETWIGSDAQRYAHRGELALFALAYFTFRFSVTVWTVACKLKQETECHSTLDNDSYFQNAQYK